MTERLILCRDWILRLPRKESKQIIIQHNVVFLPSNSLLNNWSPEMMEVVLEQRALWIRNVPDSPSFVFFHHFKNRLKKQNLRQNPRVFWVVRLRIYCLVEKEMRTLLCLFRVRYSTTLLGYEKINEICRNASGSESNSLVAEVEEMSLILNSNKVDLWISRRWRWHCFPVYGVLQLLYDHSVIVNGRQDRRSSQCDRLTVTPGS